MEERGEETREYRRCSRRLWLVSSSPSVPTPHLCRSWMVPKQELHRCQRAAPAVRWNAHAEENRGLEATEVTAEAPESTAEANEANAAGTGAQAPVLLASPTEARSQRGSLSQLKRERVSTGRRTDRCARVRTPLPERRRRWSRRKRGRRPRSPRRRPNAAETGVRTTVLRASPTDAEAKSQKSSKRERVSPGRTTDRCARMGTSLTAHRQRRSRR